MPILDNFESQYIKEASELEHGIMSYHDKVKLDGINLDDINYINTELEKIKEEMIPQFIYGIKIDTSNKNPISAVTYTDDAVGFIPLSVDQNTGICNYGSWKNIIDNVFAVQPCLVKNNGDVLFKLNPDDYTKTVNGDSIDTVTGNFGQVMIRIKHLYYKFSMEGNYLKFQISNKRIDHTWIDTAFASEDGIGTIKNEMYISAYEAVQKNNTLQSLSGGSPEFKLNFDEIEYLSNTGVFNMINIIKKQFIIFLGYLVTKSIDLESTIGSGNSTGPILKSGTMNNKGLFYGKNNKTDGVKLFGIENLWGNQLKYMHGIVQKLTYVTNTVTGAIEPEQHIYIKEFAPYNKIEDFTDTGKIEPNLSGYISSLKFLSNAIYIPKDLNGATNNYFKSYFQNGISNNSDNRLYGIYGGNNTQGDKVGSEFLLLGYLDQNQVTATTHLIY